MMLLRWGTPGKDALRAVLEESRLHSPSYASGDELAGKWNRLRTSTALPLHAAVMEKSRKALENWLPHRAAGVTIFPRDATLEKGTTLLVLLPVGCATVISPCRITKAEKGEFRTGFAYATLPGHPECGEEAFYVDRNPETGAATFTVSAVSKPAILPLRLAGPVGTVLQRSMARKYLKGMLDAHRH